jgi:hypothetical protein
MEATFKTLSSITDHVAVSLQQTRDYTAKRLSDARSSSIFSKFRDLSASSSTQYDNYVSGEIAFDTFELVLRIHIEVEDPILLLFLSNNMSLKSASETFFAVASARTSLPNDIHDTVYINSPIAKIRLSLRVLLCTHPKDFLSIVENVLSTLNLSIRLSSLPETQRARMNQQIAWYTSFFNRNIRILPFHDSPLLSSLPTYSGDDLDDTCQPCIRLILCGSRQIMQSFYHRSIIVSTDKFVCYENREGYVIRKVESPFSAFPLDSSLPLSPMPGPSSHPSSFMTLPQHVWIIGHKTFSQIMYWCSSFSPSPFPPAFGWEVIGVGKHPPPVLEPSFLPSVSPIVETNPSASPIAESKAPLSQNDFSCLPPLLKSLEMAINEQGSWGEQGMLSKRCRRRVALRCARIDDSEYEEHGLISPLVITPRLAAVDRGDLVLAQRNVSLHNIPITCVLVSEEGGIEAFTQRDSLLKDNISLDTVLSRCADVGDNLRRQVSPHSPSPFSGPIYRTTLHSLPIPYPLGCIHRYVIYRPCIPHRFQAWTRQRVIGWLL